MYVLVFAHSMFYVFTLYYSKDNTNLMIDSVSEMIGVIFSYWHSTKIHIYSDFIS